MHTNIFSIIRGKETFISSHLSASQEDLVVTEAKGQNSFPFCDECPSAGCSTESLFVVLLDNIHHGWQTMADDTLALVGCFYVSGVQAGLTLFHQELLAALQQGRVREVHSLYLYLSRK